MAQEIKANKIYLLDKDEPPEGKSWAEVVEDARLSNIKEILALPAILARNYRDYLIEADNSVDPPTCKWKEDLVNQLDSYYSGEVRMIIKKKLEIEKNKIPLSRPITRHTSS